MLRVPQILTLDAAHPAEAALILNTQEPHPIACNNWAASYPYTPQATFQIAHNGRWLFVHFTVSESVVKAEIREDNGEVWTDSCVEFFIAPDHNGYYNFEFTCIGKVLLGYRKERPSAIHANADILHRIQRHSTLGTCNFQEKSIVAPWQLTAGIPISALFRHAYPTWQGLRADVNVYKCGDKLSRPHYLSWQPIDTPRPDFHVPRCFAEVSFD